MAPVPGYHELEAEREGEGVAAWLAAAAGRESRPFFPLSLSFFLLSSCSLGELVRDQREGRSCWIMKLGKPSPAGEPMTRKRRKDERKEGPVRGSRPAGGKVCHRALSRVKVLLR